MITGYSSSVLLAGRGMYEPDSQHKVSIAGYVILTLLTCGLFNLYWNHRQMKACNDLLGREEFSFWAWLLLSMITCGIYHVFYQYKMGRAIGEIQHNRGLYIFENLPILSVMITIIGLPFVVDCIHQNEINKIVTPDYAS